MKETTSEEKTVTLQKQLYATIIKTKFSLLEALFCVGNKRFLVSFLKGQGFNFMYPFMFVNSVCDLIP